jgi:hypothetical protein
MGNEAAQESNLPSDGLRRPAGFEDPLGYGDSQLIETEFGAVGLPGGLPDSVGLRRWKASKTWARATCSLSSWCVYADLQAFPRCGKACGGEVPHRRRRIRTVLSGPLELPLATRSGFRSAVPRVSARPARRRDAEIGADLAHEPEIDLAIARHGCRALGVEAPEAVVAAFRAGSRAPWARRWRSRSRRFTRR